MEANGLAFGLEGGSETTPPCKGVIRVLGMTRLRYKIAFQLCIPVTQ